MKLLRTLLGVFILLTSFEASASHIIGGDIQYEYLGNNQYYIKLVLYRESTGIPLLPTETVDVRSASCGITTSIQLPRTAQYLATNFAFNCISQQSAGFLPEVNVYETTVNNPLTLTANCSDFKLSWDVCCKPPGITNLAGNSATLGFYFEAELNRRQGIGNNSSPVFVSDPIAYICEGGNFIYTQNVTEADGDSLEYELIDPREWRGGAVVTLPYVPQYSKNMPFGIDPQNPYRLDQNTGNITFTADLPAGITREVSVIAVKVNEYRYDSLYGIWDKIGSSNREIQVIITSNCLPQVNQGVKLDPNAQGTYLDPDGTQVRDYGCGDTTVTLHFNLSVECFSVANDGTDFRITAPNGQPIPVKTATPFCDNNFETDSVRLTLYKPLLFNGDYQLYSKTGTDGNTILNKCGLGMNEFDTIILRVSGCLSPDYNMRNVTVVNDQHTYVEWGLDTTTLPEDLVDFIRVYRSDDNGATYSQVGIANVNDAGYNDYGVNSTMVDAQELFYQVQFVANGTELQVTSPIHSILLQGALNGARQVPVNWSVYDGWAANYSLELGVSNGSGYNWSAVSDPVFPTPNTSYTYNASTLSPGSYALRIRTDVNQGFQSESNWITFQIPEPPEQPGVALNIPNVFSPGPDQFNGRWTIEGIDSYSSVEITVYDRWGKKVYEDNNYTNSSAWDGRSTNGRELADGTYFYVITASGGPNGDSLEKNGSITLMRDK